ncbi:MAG: hypothetical protein M1830_009847 [Pleopsidium flavum]|nr:MAG: hypothetical protein M1830_009847 [Pleopsidium flavum]
MFYDLNVPWTPNNPELQRTLAFLAELGYNVVALNHTVVGKLPADLSSPIPTDLRFPTARNLRILRRCTLVLSDPAQNHRLSTLSQRYDLLAIRPTTEKALHQACSLDCDLISLDLTTRFPSHFKHKTLSTALQRGVKFELCYAPGVLATDSSARRNLISNATQLIRATRGRGIIISSEAMKAVGCRGPWDVINLAMVWGLGQERGREAVGTEARSVVVQAELKRRSYRGVVDVIYGGEKPHLSEALHHAEKGKGKGPKQGIENGQKRKVDILDDGTEQESGQAKPMSKREQKRQAKKAKLDAFKKTDDSSETSSAALAPKSSDSLGRKPMAAANG